MSVFFDKVAQRLDKLDAADRRRQFRQLADEGTKKLDQMEEAGRFVLESPAEPEQEKLPQ